MTAMVRLKRLCLVIISALILFLIAHVYVTKSTLSNNYVPQDHKGDNGFLKLNQLPSLGQKSLGDVIADGRPPNVVGPNRLGDDKLLTNSSSRVQGNPGVVVGSVGAMGSAFLRGRVPLSGQMPMGVDVRQFGINPEKYALDMARMRIRLELFGLRAMRGQRKLNGTRLLLPSLDGVPKRQIAIVTYWRSGSTFLGDILNQSPATYYHFEPLHALSISEVMNSTAQETRALNLISNLLQCNYTHLDKKYLQWVRKSENQFLMWHNTRLWNTCRMRVRLCSDASFLTSICREYPTQLVKLVRLRISASRRLLVDNPALKMVYLVRDPRGMYSSRKGLDWCNSSRSCGDPSEVCNQLRQDILTAQQLRQEFPERFIALRYEDISVHPEQRTQELFKFLGLEVNRQVSTYLRSHTTLRAHENANNPYSTKRNSKSTPFLWRHKLTYEEIQHIQEECYDVLKSLHYPPIRNSEELKRDDVDYVDWLYGSHEDNGVVL